MRRRFFLNKHGFNSVAAIYAKVGKKGVDNELIISDCGHTVVLDVNGYDAQTRENTLFKIDTLVAVLTEFQVALSKEFDKWDD